MLACVCFENIIISLVAMACECVVCIITTLLLAGTAACSLHTLIAGHMCAGGMVAEYEAAAGLLAQLQALGAGPLWPHEAASLSVPRTPSEHSIATAVRCAPYRARSFLFQNAH